MDEIECEQVEDFCSLLDSYVESDPQDALVLDEPLSLEDLAKDSKVEYSPEGLKLRPYIDSSTSCSVRMHSEERAFAECLVKRGLMVYREPHVKDCDSIPDFYVYNPESHIGTVVEITMCERKALTARKKKQIANLSRSCDFYGLRLMVLYRDNIRSVLKHMHSQKSIENVVA